MTVADSVEGFVESLHSNIRFADLLDIAVIAFVLYVALVWIRRARARSAVGFAAVAAGLAGVYLLATRLGMYVTAFVFRAGIAVIVIALIVVFQDDLRRMFHRSLHWRRRRRESDGKHGWAEYLEQAISAMASRRVGALIVIGGDEPIEQHLTGGVPIDGKISAAILESIFHPGSPGHDGAVVIEGDRLVRFGVHLPLARDHSWGPNFGTRHAAAVGLSELSDALAIIVSEERGEVGVAERGEIEHNLSPERLHARILDFHRRTHPVANDGTKRPQIFRDLPLKATSLATSIMLWFAIAARTETVQRTYLVPIEYRNVAENMHILDPKPRQAALTLSGSPSAFRTIDPQALKVSIDLRNATDGRPSFILGRDTVTVPGGVEVYEVEPRSIELSLERTEVVEVAVQAATRGKLAEGLDLVAVRIRPASVALRMPLDKKKKTLAATTEPIDLSSIGATVTVKADLLLPKHARPVGTDVPRVEVTIEVRAEPVPPSN